MKRIQMTVVMDIDDDENPRKWDVSEWLDMPGVIGWTITNLDTDPACTCSLCENKEA